jgi:formylglycine-generating enzyme required for sulfatase activity
MYRNHLSPPQFPAPWALDWGEDTYGLWMTFALNGIRQGLRWIRPGAFMMGAAADESGQRPWSGKETRHKVILSRGFWLADTTVTQEMWRTVMHGNPSGFTGDRHPVERVSWNDAQAFLLRLNTFLPRLNPRLPREAEWEYACRAGTEMPFSFGADITSEQVNYNGKYPYRQGQADLFRKRTETVKSLPCNSWGLYEMHGNVWEWCQDGWKNDLSTGSVTDPQGPKEGRANVVRGGSWVCDGRFVRSASRDRYDPDYCLGSTGLRLAVTGT